MRAFSDELDALIFFNHKIGKPMMDDRSVDLCMSFKKAFACMGQGIFGTTICNEWNPEFPQPTTPNGDVENDILNEK
jgi:hypothetical protein